MSTPEKWEVRVGDAEREAMVETLRSHFALGRLTLDEFEERTESALAARTRADLAPLTSDLPALRTRPSGPPIRFTERQQGRWDVGFRIHVGVWAVLAVFFVLIWLFAGAGYFWPVWPIAGIGVSVGVHLAVRSAVRS